MKNNGSLNRIYRLVWSHVLNGWVAVAESARGTGKGSSRKLVAAALSLSSVWAHAGPQGGAVVSGEGSIAKSGATTTINQSSQNLSLSWQSFNVGTQDVVNFLQPSATAVAINRIHDTNGSQILGQINANGQVYLINPNGILFGQGAQVNVGALVASTLDLSDASLDSTTRVFSGTGAGSIINQGTINAAGSGSGGGYVALLGNTVINQGTITAPQGTVALGAGSATTLTFEGSNLIGMQIDQGVLDSLAENNGLIRADGGVVMMSAGARNELLASVVNNTGVLEARTVESHEGVITLLAGMSTGTVQVGGTLDASATSGGNGGFIETSAANVKFVDDAEITTAATSGATGTWLIDPTDFTIDAGDGTQTVSGMGAEKLSDALDDNNVHIMTSDADNGSDKGDINVNADVTWSTNKLTLTAHNDININAVMTANDTASLNLQPASKGGSGNVVTGRNTDGSFKGRVDFFQAGGTIARSGTGFLTIGANDYTVIGTVAELQAMEANTHYAVGSNIDNANVAFTSIANFNSTFDGLGHTISNLAISGGVNTGLFGQTTDATIQNIGLMSGSVTGNAGTGALIGNMNSGTVNNSYSTASVSGDAGTGGLVGSMVGAGGSIHNSYATGAVKGDAATGGLVGSLANSGDITNSYATGNVHTAFAGAAGVGGLVGSSAASGNISNSYATGSVTSTGAGTAGTGGLVGSSAASGTISDSYATGNVQNTGAGGAGFGGLVGSSAASGNISTSYATGDVTSSGAGAAATGGLVGSNTSGAISESFAVGDVSGGGAGTGGLVGSNTLGTISESFAAGTVTGLGASTGGLVGSNAGTIHDTYAAGNVSGSGAGTGGLVGHNFGIVSNSYAAGVVKGNADTVGSFVGSDVPGTVTNSFWKIPDGGFVNMTGTDSLISMGLTHDQLKTQANFTGSTTANGNNSLAWDFSNVWTMPPSTASYVYPIFKKLVQQVTVTANSASKTYDGQTYTGAIGGTLSSPLNPTIGTITYGGDWASKINAGTYLITPELTVSNAHLSPYYVINSTVGTLAIAKAALTVTDTVASGTTYNGTRVADLSGGTLVGVVTGENVTLTQAGTYASADAGTQSITANARLGGNANLSNYTLTQATGLSANIDRATLTLADVTADSRAYNGNTDATLGGTATGLVEGESLSLSGLFASKDAGTGIAVTVSTADGENGLASNYTLADADQSVAANIAKAALTVTDTVASGTTYNGTTAANLSGGTLVGVVGTEDVTLTQAGTYASANAGTQSITANASLGGSANLDNYTLTQATGLSATIAKAALTATATAANKTYDGTDSAIAYLTLAGLVNNESLGSTNTATFNSQSVNDANLVTVNAAALVNGSGANAGLASNYALAAGQTAAANITPAPAPAPTPAPAPNDATLPAVTTPPTNGPNDTTLEALNGAALTAASMISIPGLNPTVGELTANTSTTTDTTENGVNVVTKQLDDGSRSLQIINGGMTPSRREVDTEEVSAAEITNAATVAGT